MEHKLPVEVLEELTTNQNPTIVMSEGNDPRIITGAAAAFNTGMCQIVPVSYTHLTLPTKA